MSMVCEGVYEHGVLGYMSIVCEGVYEHGV